ncbi:TrbC/VIRB2 family protein [Labrenzia sp. THAF82]|uniref:TrbC/VirB2 family protein n=1 Tax=Labrenzia sp. THAF82 TaxID=2587861 RepID=UPI0012691A53|nr:TrbC/VirB2 family protein [Labrenzia sp. THAF82]QFT29589.1 TrbC/VIRB2 family protein [Labrenzia sp. THAF82]
MTLIKTPGIRSRLLAKAERASLSLSSFLTTCVAFPATALAAAGWADQATTMFTDLENGLVSFAAPVIGIGVIVYGIWAMGTGRIDIVRLGQLVCGGALVMFGPAALRTLVGA